MKLPNSPRPESLMMSHAYDPASAGRAIKAPMYLASTFSFAKAEEGKAYFELAYGLREKEEREEMGMIYSRIDNPNLSVLESRLCLWDQAEDCAVFQSGMAAISTVLLEFLSPGDLLLYSSPTYGGTDHFITHFLRKIGVECLGFRSSDTKEDIIRMVEASGKAHRLSFIYLETPANPTSGLFDIEMCREIADYFGTEEQNVNIAVDNTYMGPLWSHPLQLGADLVLYSATKYIGGHSDLLAGAVLGNAEMMKRVKTLRTFLGSMASPHTSWLLLRSLETLKIRMEQQARNAAAVAEFLNDHPAVGKVLYLGNLQPGTRDYDIYRRQYTSPGAMIAFEVVGGEKAAFQFMNNLKLIKIAVSLGGTESLIEHPDTMTHAGVDPELKEELGINESLVRLSVGVENSLDLMQDIETALGEITVTQSEPSLVLAAV